MGSSIELMKYWGFRRLPRGYEGRMFYGVPPFMNPPAWWRGCVYDQVGDEVEAYPKLRVRCTEKERAAWLAKDRR